MSDERLLEWVRLAAENEDLVDYTTKVQGQTGKADGYMSNIIFVMVMGRTQLGKPKTLNLVIKWSKESSKLREQIPIREAFEKEIFIYDNVKENFAILQEEKTSENLLNFLPKVYASLATGTSEVLIMENLKPQGYDVCDRKKPMTFEHVKLILEMYGRWHAFSLALKKEKPQVFETLLENQINIYPYWLEKLGNELFFNFFTQARNKCIDPEENTLLEKLQFSKMDIDRILIGSYKEETNDQVILHGDCWTNNFLFKYQENTNNPLSICAIDFQLSGFASPIMDLSFFIYACCQTDVYKDVEEFLKIYYQSLSHALEKLDVAVDTFSYDKLLQHWWKFSSYGLVISSLILTFSVQDSEDAADFTETAENGKEFLDNFSLEIKNPEEYNKRMRNNLIHYVDNLK